MWSVQVAVGCGMSWNEEEAAGLFTSGLGLVRNYGRKPSLETHGRNSCPNHQSECSQCCRSKPRRCKSNNSRR